MRISKDRLSRAMLKAGVATKKRLSELSGICPNTIPAFISELLGQYRKWWIEKRLMWGSSWQGDKERLFVQDDGKPINPDTINFWMNKFLEKHDFPHITPHSLRHTFTTLQITAGVDMRTLQSRTGHAQASTLINTYSHAIKSAQEKATAALEAVLLPTKKQG
ncbi:tyrosine-type recombinase/integrase [Ruminococcaceae bacterium OttesenSCG-928-I18]|nr:tyrosine-type recombinase/integrase [Ruminococcaceae bacterium OttesenSCG-928-I18]